MNSHTMHQGPSSCGDGSNLNGAIKQAPRESLWQRLQTEFIGALGALLLRALYPTYRWQFLGLARENTFFEQLKRPVIFVFWHNRQLLMPRFYELIGGPGGNLYTMISRHRDGRRIARAVELLGFHSVAGSSTRGGSEALLQLRRLLSAGRHVAMTPDGPRGPVEKLKPGCIALARNSGVPIYPVAIGFKSAWRFKSWDGMYLPRPFSRVVGVIGDPITVAADCVDNRVERMRVVVEAALNAVTKEADQFSYDS